MIFGGGQNAVGGIVRSTSTPASDWATTDSGPYALPSAGVALQPVGDLLLHGEDQQRAPSDQQLNDERRGDVVRQVGDQLRPARRRQVDRRVQRVLAGQGVTLDDVDPFPVPLACGGGEVAVDLDGRHPRPAFQQLVGQRARAWADLDDVLAGHELAGVGDEADDGRLDHKVLPEPVPRPGLGGGEDRVDLALRLRQASPYVLHVEHREAIEGEYLKLTRQTLPKLAAEAGDWPIRFDHCFMRVCLDHAFGGCWYDHVDRKRGPAYKVVPTDKLRGAIDVARRIERGGRGVLVPLNRQSLLWRGKAT